MFCFICTEFHLAQFIYSVTNEIVALFFSDQDGTEIAVAVKTCKIDGETAMTDQLLKEAGKLNYR